MGVPVKSYGSMNFASRQTYLINPDGKIVKFWPNVWMTISGIHSTNVLSAIAAGGE